MASSSLVRGSTECRCRENFLETALPAEEMHASLQFLAANADAGFGGDLTAALEQNCVEEPSDMQLQAARQASCRPGTREKARSSV